MALYESESSEDDPTSFTTTNVLLGYASKELTDDGISQLGGQPVWIDPSHPLPLNSMVCKVCNKDLSLLLQLHGDLPEHFPRHERRLFVFGCRSRKCQRTSGSIRVFRSVRSSRPSTPQTLKVTQTSRPGLTSTIKDTNDLGNTIFGTGSIFKDTCNTNPFTVPREFLETEAPPLHDLFNPFPIAEGESRSMSYGPELPGILVDESPLNESLQQSQSIPSRSPDKSTLSFETKDSLRKRYTAYRPFPLYYLEADYETLDCPTISSSRLTFIDMESSLPLLNRQSATKDNPEAFESALDKTFQRFADRLAQNSLQVLRYEFRGSPLLYSKQDEIGRRLCGAVALHESAIPGNAQVMAGTHLNIPACENCGTTRVFELQLTPHVISLLEESEDGVEGMEWGTIIIGVCDKDCIESGPAANVSYVEEWAGVQWEEM